MSTHLLVFFLIIATRAQEIHRGVGNNTWHLAFLDQCVLSPTTTGRGVTIYIVDSGCDIAHNEFQDADIKSYNLEGPDFKGKIPDSLGSGTHMASLIAGRNLGVAKSARVSCIRAYNDTGKSTESDLLRGIDKALALHAARADPAVLVMTSQPDAKIEVTKWLCFAEDLNAIVIRDTCISPVRWYDEPKSVPYCAANLSDCKNNINRWLLKAHDAGLRVITSAGNNAGDACSYSPSRIPFGLKFGALDSTGSIWSRSNTGPCVDFYAPGVNVTGAWNTGADDYRSDRAKTSTAAALGAAVVARLLEDRPEATTEDLREQLRAASKPEAAGKEKIRALKIPCLPTPNPSPSPSPPPAESCSAGSVGLILGRAAVVALGDSWVSGFKAKGLV
mmetsp:Transcript_13163/g.33389  ORF Transcript_13163/g.33389 Transcript_13163/m.33389 type:complete len:390 (-) Transcript_13163:855-2024(-)